jgi:hypothetical protein
MTGPAPAPKVDQADLLDAQLEQKDLQAELLLQQHEANTPVNTAKDVGLSVASGARNAVAGLPGLPADIANLGIMGANWLGRKADTARGIEPAPDVPAIPWGSRQSTQAFNDVTGIPDYQPQTTAGRYAGKAAEFAVPALIGPAGLAATSARVGSGIVSGITSEGAGDLAASAGWSPAAQEGARLVGGLGTGVALGARGALRPNAGDMLARRGLGADTNLAPAYERQAEGIAAGLPLMGHEALQNQEISQLAAQTARQPGPAGRIMGQAYDKRANEVPRAVEGLMSRTIGPEVTNPPAVAAQVSQTAENAILRAQQQRTAASSPFFQAAANEQAPAAEVGAIRQEAQDLAPQLSNAAGRRTNQFARDLTSRVPGSADPETRIGTLDSIRKDWNERMGLPAIASSAVSQEARGTIGEGVGRLTDVLTRANEDFAYGMWRHADFTDNVIRPLMDGPISKIKDAKSISAISDIMVNPAEASPASIAQAARVLNQVEPDAYRNWARIWLENNLNIAEKKGANVGQDFLVRSMQGTKGRANFQAVLNGVAEANGMQPAEITTAWNRAINVIGNMSKKPGEAVGSSFAEANKEAPTRMSAIRNIDLTKPLEVFGQLFNPEAARETYATLAKAFTSEDSVTELRALAHAQPFGPKQQLAVRQLLTAPSAAQGDTPSEGQPLRVKIPGPQTAQ